MASFESEFETRQEASAGIGARLLEDSLSSHTGGKPRSAEGDKHKTSEREEQMAALQAGLETLVTGFSEAFLEHSANEPDHPKDLFAKVRGLFEQVPANTTVSDAQFEQTFGRETATLLKQVGITTVSHTQANGKPDHYVLGFPAKATSTVKGAEINHDQNIEFDVILSQDNIKLTNMKGLKVKKQGGTFSARLDEININHDTASGNLIVEGKGHFLFFSGSKKIIFGPDGKPLPEQK